MDTFSNDNPSSTITASFCSHFFVFHFTHSLVDFGFSIILWFSMLITNELIFMTTVFLCLNSSRTLLQPYIAQGLVVPIIDQYERDQERAQQNLSRRVPGLK